MDDDKNSNQNFNFQTGIGPVTDNILNAILDRFTTAQFQGKLLNKIVSPLTNVINEKIKPYVYISIGLYVFIVLLLFIIIFLVVRKKK